MALDEADILKITELMGGALKKHAEEQTKATEALVGKAIKTLEIDKKLEGLKTGVDEKLAALPKPAEGGGEGGKPADGGKSAAGVEESAAFRKLQSEVDDFKKKAEQQAKRAEESEARRQTELLSNTVRDSLIAAGADPKRVPYALSHLREKGVVKLNDKGEAVFVLRRDWGDEPVPATEAAKEWLATEDGKFFVPPSNAQGTGDSAGKKPGEGGKQVNAKDALASAFGRIF